MENVNIKIKGKINFNDKLFKQYNRSFTAKLIKNKAAFQYGNGLMVIIKYGKLKNGSHHDSEYLDVRYAKIEPSEKGLAKYLAQWFRLSLAEHTLTLTFNNEEDHKK